MIVGDLPPVRTTRKTGNETFGGLPEGESLTLLDFWQWALSDLVSNATRGILAEFLVASALGVNKGVRNEWDAYDVKTACGVKIEVKSAAYIQSWYQQKLSNIVFSIRPTQAWDYATNLLAKEKKRQGDIYVFCLLRHKDKDTVNPMDLLQWTFYVVSRRHLEGAYPTARSLSLLKLEGLDPKVCDFAGLRQAIEETVGNSPPAAGPCNL